MRILSADSGSAKARSCLAFRQIKESSAPHPSDGQDNMSTRAAEGGPESANIVGRQRERKGAELSGFQTNKRKLCPTSIGRARQYEHEGCQRQTGKCEYCQQTAGAQRRTAVWLS